MWVCAPFFEALGIGMLPSPTFASTGIDSLLSFVCLFLGFITFAHITFSLLYVLDWSFHTGQGTFTYAASRGVWLSSQLGWSLTGKSCSRALTTSVLYYTAGDLETRRFRVLLIHSPTSRPASTLYLARCRLSLQSLAAWFCVSGGFSSRMYLVCRSVARKMERFSR